MVITEPYLSGRGSTGGPYSASHRTEQHTIKAIKVGQIHRGVGKSISQHLLRSHAPTFFGGF